MKARIGRYRLSQVRELKGDISEKLTALEKNCSSLAPLPMNTEASDWNHKTKVNIKLKSASKDIEISMLDLFRDKDGNVRVYAPHDVLTDYDGKVLLKKGEYISL